MGQQTKGSRGSKPAQKPTESTEGTTTESTARGKNFGNINKSSGATITNDE